MSYPHLDAFNHDDIDYFYSYVTSSITTAMFAS